MGTRLLARQIIWHKSVPCDEVGVHEISLLVNIDFEAEDLGDVWLFLFRKFPDLALDEGENPIIFIYHFDPVEGVNFVVLIAFLARVFNVLVTEDDRLYLPFIPILLLQTVEDFARETPVRERLEDFFEFFSVCDFFGLSGPFGFFST